MAHGISNRVQVSSSSNAQTTTIGAANPSANAPALSGNAINPSGASPTGIQNSNQVMAVLMPLALMAILGKGNSPAATATTTGQTQTTTIDFDDNTSIQNQMAKLAGNDPNILSWTNQLNSADPSSQTAATLESQISTAMQKNGMDIETQKQFFMLNGIATLNSTSGNTNDPNVAANKNNLVQQYQASVSGSGNTAPQTILNSLISGNPAADNTSPQAQTVNFDDNDSIKQKMLSMVGNDADLTSQATQWLAAGPDSSNHTQIGTQISQAMIANGLPNKTIEQFFILGGISNLNTITGNLNNAVPPAGTAESQQFSDRLNAINTQKSQMVQKYQQLDQT